MFKILKLITLSLVIVIALTAIAKPTIAIAVADIEKNTCDGIKAATGATDCKDTGSISFSGIITNVINILSILVGAVSVIMIIVGGFRYIISNGDSNSTKGAKDTIMYALIGLIIVLFAQVIVRFVWTNAKSAMRSTTEVIKV